jgi:hypothetical protein
MARPYLGGSNACIKAVSADTTLGVGDSGNNIIVDASTASTNFTITLPATATSKGVSYDIICGVASHSASTVLVTSDTNIVGGTLLWSTGVVTEVASGASRGFGDSAKAGSRMHIVCDGTQWLILNANSDVAFVASH